LKKEGEEATELGEGNRGLQKKPAEGAQGKVDGVSPRLGNGSLGKKGGVEKRGAKG